MKAQFRRGDPQRREYWESVVRRWKAGEESAREFCRTEGLRESAFYFWRRKLEHDSELLQAAMTPRPKPSRMASRARSWKLHSPPSPGMASFLPVRVTASADEESRSVTRWVLPGDGGVEIVLGPGRSVRVQSGFDRDTLAAVLAVLEPRPC